MNDNPYGHPCRHDLASTTSSASSSRDVAESLGGSNPHELTIAGVILRINQIDSLPDESALRELLIMRLKTSDVPRLREMLRPETLAWIAEIEAEWS